MNRAKLSVELETIRKHLPDVLGTLEKNTEWYGSVFLEKKTAKTYSANLKQTQVSDQATMGAVLRVYDGYTLYEQATDEVDSAALLKTAQALVKRVESAKIAPGLQKRPYRAKTWKERMSVKLDSEITSQIPSSVTSSTPVHFGIQFEKDPVSEGTEPRLNRLKGILDRAQALAPKAGLKKEDLSFLLARETVAVEESIFIDRESNLSQALYRVSMVLMFMSGSDRAVNRFGGLGGAETIETDDEKIMELLNDLAALKKADRLVPGRYRVLMSPTISGVLAHEAFGHSQEGDTWARGRSKARELAASGEKAGNDLATILNNPAVYKNGAEKGAAWGSYFFDEEGWLAREQVLLDRGVLQPPMTNLTSAIRLGVDRSANGKRESWQNGVYTRQTNTYFSAGDKTLDELMVLLGDGYVALNAAGGMEDPKGMGIQVGIQYLKEVKGGKFTGKIVIGPAGGDIQLTGYVPDVLNSIVAKSKIEAEKTEKDKATHPFNDCGGCGKYHKEIVYAGCGGPYMLLKDMILG